MRDAAAHYACADYRRVRNFFRHLFRAAPFVLLRQEKIADQVLRRVGLAEFGDGVELRGQRLIEWKIFADDFERARRCEISARTRRACFSLTGGAAVRLSPRERGG